MNNITLNLTNYTYNIDSYIYNCTLDTLDILNQVEKTPQIAYWFLISALIILTIYTFNPKLEQYLRHKDFFYPLFMLTFTSAFLYTFTTFTINRKLWDQIEIALYIICVVTIIYIIYREKDNIKRIKEKLE